MKTLLTDTVFLLIVDHLISSGPVVLLLYSRGGGWEAGPDLAALPRGSRRVSAVVLLGLEEDI